MEHRRSKSKICKTFHANTSSKRPSGWWSAGASLRKMSSSIARFEFNSSADAHRATIDVIDELFACLSCAFNPGNNSTFPPGNHRHDNLLHLFEHGLVFAIVGDKTWKMEPKVGRCLISLHNQSVICGSIWHTYTTEVMASSDTSRCWYFCPLLSFPIQKSWDSPLVHVYKSLLQQRPKSSCIDTMPFDSANRSATWYLRRLWL